MIQLLSISQQTIKYHKRSRSKHYLNGRNRIVAESRSKTNDSTTLNWRRWGWRKVAKSAIEREERNRGRYQRLVRRRWKTRVSVAPVMVVILWRSARIWWQWWMVESGEWFRELWESSELTWFGSRLCWWNWTRNPLNVHSNWHSFPMS